MEGVEPPGELKDAGGDDTIAAVATPAGAGAIGIIRISGPAAVDAAARIVRLRTGTLHTAPSQAMRRATVVDPVRGEMVDEGFCTVMRAPRSSTGEDVVEISCHGSPVVLRRVLRLLTASGVRLAEPGEFTRRAYLNGRLDLAQAEAVAALISARTERAAALAARSMAGGWSERLESIRQRALDVVAGLEVALDFPDEAVGLGARDAAKLVTGLVDEVTRLLTAAHDGRLIYDGLTAVIVGAPNVGKSSLLNRLVQSDRAIVSPTPGTTRDLVDGVLTIAGVSVRLVDTAGLSPTDDPIEAEGMRRTRRAAQEGDLTLFVVDGHRPLMDAAAELAAGPKTLLVINKSDLPQDASLADVSGIRVSALTGDGVEQLLGAIGAWIEDRLVSDADEGGLVASVRQIEALEALRDALSRAEAALLADTPLEAVLVDLREALRLAGSVVGTDVSELVLDRIFATFCIGK